MSGCRTSNGSSWPGEWVGRSSSKDARIRSRTIEREVVRRFGVRAFYITRQDLTAVEMAQRYLNPLDAITTACQEPGPFIYAVHERRIEHLDLPD